jgi:hypothetical protein
VLFGRASPAAEAQNPQMTFNNDSGSNYDTQIVVSSTTSPTLVEAIATTFMRLGSVPAANAPANVFGTTIIDIPFYGSAQHKTQHHFQQLKISTSTPANFTDMGTGLWRSTSAITRVTIALNSGNFVTGSRCILYGLR